jgi:hypothetical protein
MLSLALAGYLPYFEKMKVGLSNLHAEYVHLNAFVCLCIPSQRLLNGSSSIYKN